MNNYWERIVKHNLCDGTAAYMVRFSDLEFSEGATVADLIAYALSNNNEHGSIAIVKPHSWLGLEILCKMDYGYGRIEADNIPEETKAKKLKSVSGFGGYSLMDYNITLR